MLPAFSPRPSWEKGCLAESHASNDLRHPQGGKSTMAGGHLLPAGSPWTSQLLLRISGWLESSQWWLWLKTTLGTNFLLFWHAQKISLCIQPVCTLCSAQLSFFSVSQDLCIQNGSDGQDSRASSGSEIILAEGAHQTLEMVGPPRSLCEHSKWLPFALGHTVVKILGFTGEEGLKRVQERDFLGCSVAKSSHLLNNN